MDSKYTPEEQTENRRKWVEALRSDKYNQTMGALCRRIDDSFEYCCLGVACAISGLGKFAPRDYSQSGVYKFVIKEGQSQDAALPEPVRDWLGLSDRYGSYRGDSPSSLSTNNDGGTLFISIANIIESEPDGLISSIGE